MNNIDIPPAALEAGAKLLCARDDWKYPWDDLEEYDMQFYRDNARAAFVAMVEAWPGMNAKAATDHVMLLNSTPALILPLMEKRT